MLRTSPALRGRRIPHREEGGILNCADCSIGVELGLADGRRTGSRQTDAGRNWRAGASKASISLNLVQNSHHALAILGHFGTLSGSWLEIGRIRLRRQDLRGCIGL